MRSFGIWVCTIGLLCGAPGMARSDSDAEEQDYTDLDLMELAALSAEVFSASKKTQKLIETPASVHVIDSEEIRRSGHTTLPELLRLVPGVSVGRITNNRWAISVRGFNQEFSSKLLVLIDGRVVYTPTFSGVYWNLQDVFLEDVDRIEVVRGPGATIWGSNAVNGVINVITKAPRADAGNHATVIVGNEEKLGVGLRASGGDESLAYQLYTKAFVRDASAAPDGSDRADEWRAQRGGGRMEWKLNRRDTLSLDSAIYHGEAGNALREYTATGLVTGIPRDTHVNVSQNGGHLIGTWKREFSERESVEIQGYYDLVLQRGDVSDDLRHNTNLDLQHRRVVGASTELIWGLGYRRSDYRIGGTDILQLAHAKGTDVTYSGFLQAEHRLSDVVRVMAGSKVEWNDLSGWEVQPSVRGIWLLSGQQQLWAGVSRAVRTASRGEREAVVTSFVLPPNSLGPGSPAVPIQTIGNPHLGSEVLVAYELGYRAQILDRLSIDVTTFWHDYENLRQAVTIPPLNLSQRLVNRGHALGLGTEALIDFRAKPWWRLTLGYALYDLDEKPKQLSSPSRLTARHQGRLSSYMQLSSAFELDSTLYWVDDATDLARQPIDSYLRWDVRLGWNVSERLSVELIGQNLMDRQHLEARSFFSPETESEIQRSVFARLQWSF